ncbi:MAG TPA: universal stress protein [Thermoanaerobaculia bacterium]|jgi:nucleotide-binding universal stress UspA family protein|nr:universal stress protein [Thermoanaerobaculia bacterium]
MKKKIVYATDFSRPSLAAFSAALSAARREGADLVVLHVLPPPVGPDAMSYVPERMYEEMKAAVVRQARRKLAALVRRAEKGRVRARAELVEGIPHEEIPKSARKHRASLVVVGTHGRTGLARLLMGSVAARVIGTCPCPVMTIRGKRR